ncbi:TPA: hypothetical protein ACX3IP_004716, partial [Vibrio parahaemolyticus]
QSEVSLTLFKRNNMAVKEPYENIYIGNFIYTLGYLSGIHNASSEEAGVHLIQQTPDDKKWSDLLTRWKGKYFFFEFKREEKGCQQELKKKYCKKTCKDNCEDHRSTYFSKINDEKYADMKGISDRSHFLGYGVRISEARTIKFIPYSSVSDSDKQSKEDVLPLSDLCKKIINSDIGVNEREFYKYLNFLSKCVDESAEGASGFVVNIDQNGNVHLVDIKDTKILANDLDKPDKTYPDPQPENARKKTETHRLGF